MSMKFEWDDAKAANNMRKHGINFEDASLVFDDFGAIEEPDDSMEYDEERFIITGLANEQLLTVIYTERSDAIRLISARKATRHEEKEYHSQ